VHLSSSNHRHTAFASVDLASALRLGGAGAAAIPVVRAELCRVNLATFAWAV